MNDVEKYVYSPFTANKHPDLSCLALSGSEFAEHPGWCIRFYNMDVIFLDPRDSSLRSRSRMMLREEGEGVNE